MASANMLITIAIIVVLAPSALAKEFVVGDEKGWTINFDYQAWAEGKDFRVGDRLIFKYTVGAHNVLRVDGNGFQQCAAPAGTEALATGNDVIMLSTPGRKWYICNVGQHCEAGKQKLAITVLPLSEAPASLPSSGGGSGGGALPPSEATGTIASKYYAWMTAALSLLMMALV
ncbi:hypothetical protein FEM48_Zijuj11G0048900 [Ziziphus jujuba var. spinosa]|uniref:Phytocyanin domain-containing protein n=1 Tax=Ziziphus jujuba var. spinosa TaxID=714518 RepID=A0A978UGY3_ZIZJJ|nr:hypothetical protein FEM48_Zijuj11G0048900 [Ziziphus jujuba var. spinosa]